MRARVFVSLALALGVLVADVRHLEAQATRPNIVLIFPDNLGWGEIGAYGAVRGVPTPNVDSIAAQGIRLDNFNVEFSCTVSRAALLTSRYAIRAAATQFGYLTGAALGGLALHYGGYAALGVTFACLYLLATLPHVGRAAVVRLRAQ